MKDGRLKIAPQQRESARSGHYHEIHLTGQKSALSRRQKRQTDAVEALSARSLPQVASTEADDSLFFCARTRLAHFWRRARGEGRNSKGRRDSRRRAIGRENFSGHFFGWQFVRSCRPISAFFPSPC